MLRWEIRLCNDDISFEFLKILKYVPVKKLMLALGIAGKEFFIRNDTVIKILTAVEYQHISIDQAISVGGGTVVCAVMGNLQNIAFESGAVGICHIIPGKQRSISGHKNFQSVRVQSGNDRSVIAVSVKLLLVFFLENIGSA